MVERGALLIARALRCVGLTLALLALSIVPGVCLVNGQAAKSAPASNGPAPAPFGGYDVVSVKPNVSGNGSMRFSTRDTTFQATNISLKMLLVNAYGIRDGLIFGLPKWAESGRWDINAKVLEPAPSDSKTSREQSTALYRTKVQSILVDRFHLAAHIETKILPIYELVLLPGPTHLQESQAPQDKRGTMSTSDRNMKATAVPLKNLASFLSEVVGRSVVDKTGLTGDYDLALKWSPDELAEAAKETGATDRPPEIYTALQEQLGLKLVPSKGPLQTLVVDTVSPPAED